jgi:hypothetical protein
MNPIDDDFFMAPNLLKPRQPLWRRRFFMQARQNPDCQSICFGIVNTYVFTRPPALEIGSSGILV